MPARVADSVVEMGQSTTGSPIAVAEVVKNSLFAFTQVHSVCPTMIYHPNMTIKACRLSEVGLIVAF